jgi:type II secretory pathway component PulF
LAVRAVLVGLAMSRFARGLSASISAWLGSLDAMQLAKHAAGRHQLSVDVDRVIGQSHAGEQSSQGLASATYTPSFARRMLTAEDESGELIRMTEIVAKHYEQELSHRMKTLTRMRERVLIVLIAGVVLMVARAIVLPMWNMVQVMS